MSASWNAELWSLGRGFNKEGDEEQEPEANGTFNTDKGSVGRAPN